MKFTHNLPWALFLFTIYMTSSAQEFEDLSLSSSSSYKRLKCFACTSYVPNCQATVNDTTGGVPHVGCKSRCFVRQGYEKELPIYRGCLDDFMSVPVLQTDYKGCRMQSWNGVDRLWCFCDTDMCNGDSMQALQAASGAPSSQYLPREDTYSDFVPGADSNDQTKYYDNFASVQEYAKESTEPSNYDTDVGYGGSQERYTDGGVDRPYFPGNEKVYTDVEQVRYQPGNNNNNNNLAYNNQPTEYQRPYAPPQKPHRDLDPYDTSFVKQPYYPYEQNKPQKRVKYHDVRSGQYEQRMEMKSDYSPKDGAHQGTEQYGAHSSSYQSSTSSTSSTTVSPTVPLPDRVLCSHTGFIPNPDDCSSFLACIMDAHLGKPLMHRMRCPSGLFWDNSVRTCVPTSSTCDMKKVYEVEYRDPPPPPPPQAPASPQGGYQPPHTTYTSRPDSHTTTGTISTAPNSYSDNNQ